MPTPESSFIPQDNIALENEAYTQVFGPDNNGKMLGYGCGITKSKLFGYGSVTQGSQYTSAISTLIEEMSAKHVEANTNNSSRTSNSRENSTLGSRISTFYGGRGARSSFDS
ncbi:hypothetical protein V6Z11_A11G273800 [Gossypium hirsutum]